jgi:hypothetical protein
MTDNQIAASRANGAKSHGPVTEEGRQRSSMNALKHGLYSELVVNDGESMEMFNNLRQGYLDRFQPADPVELDMVEQMVSASWRIRRLWAAEAEILNDAMDLAAKWLETEGYEPGAKIPEDAAMGIAHMKKERSLAILGGQEARLTRMYHHAFETLCKLQKQNQKTTNEPSEIANKELPEPQPAEQAAPEPPCPPPTAHCPLPSPHAPCSPSP